jgi:hypothetical protein
VGSRTGQRNEICYTGFWFCFKEDIAMSLVTSTSEFTLTLNEEQRTHLLSFLEQALEDAHAEARRTDAPGYQEVVHRNESMLRGLIDKLRHP